MWENTAKFLQKTLDLTLQETAGFKELVKHLLIVLSPLHLL